jgi:inner membrane protein
MPTIYTHGIVGLGMGKMFTSRKLPWLFWALAFLLPMVPDLDCFSSAPYGSIWGHRGFSHSLLFALAAAVVTAALTFRRFAISFWDLWGFFFVITASHGVLDAFTNGGFGIPFFWPIDNTRYGLWGPIQVSDIGFEIPNFRTSRTVYTELLYVWLPTGALVLLVWLARWLRARTQETRTV